MRDMESPRSTQPHGLTLESRQKAVVTGVESVDSFNEQMVVLATTAGTLTLLGAQLHVSRLNLEDGQLLVEGEIDALEYDDRRAAGRGSLLSRLFR